MKAATRAPPRNRNAHHDVLCRISERPTHLEVQAAEMALYLE